LKKEDLSREELFALVWEQPTSVLAKEMGISDVALAKFCKRMQIPKPPRGYWAQVEAGQVPRKPPLKAFIDEIAIGKNKNKYTQLTETQGQYLKLAIEELEKAGEDVSSCEFKNGELRQIDPDLASRVIVLMQNGFKRWLPKDAGSRKVDGASGAVGRMIQKLLPKARKHVVVMKIDKGVHTWRKDESTLFLRITPNLIQELTRLNKLVMDHQLEFVTREIGDLGHAWRCNYLSSPYGWSGRAEELCVSGSHFWAVCRSTDEGEKKKLETERIPLSRFVPSELTDREFKRLPPVIPEKQCRWYADRIKALTQARRMYRMVIDHAFELDPGQIRKDFSVVQRLWLGKGADEPFDKAIEQVKELQDALETWEITLGDESEKLCQDILGLAPGDDVAFTVKGKNVRIRVRRASMTNLEDEVLFVVDGYRYRKDGLPGKKEESLFLKVENDGWRQGKRNLPRQADRLIPEFSASNFLL
jgi:hypothetical protein